MELNPECNAPHPNIDVHVFVEVLLRREATTYVTVQLCHGVRSINSYAVPLSFYLLLSV